MGVFQRIGRELDLIGGLQRTLKAYEGLTADAVETLGDDIERSVDKHAKSVAFRFEGQTLTYAEFDALMNRYAHWALAQGLKKGDSVALFMHNRPDYVACWMGLSKIGVVTAMINTNLIGAPLAHTINISGADHLILSDDLAEAYLAVAPQLTRQPKAWAFGGPVQTAADLNDALAHMPASRPARPPMKGDDVALYVYTSGTTGAPKAARLKHFRVQGMLRAFTGGGRATAKDKVYITLPLYHATGGVCGVGFALSVGGAVIIRRKFSATQFFEDCAKEGATVFFYVGELCRYLLNSPAGAYDQKHSLRIGVGNGLRPEVWERFQARFKIPRFLEFYGSTEGNVALLNFDGKPGAIGRVPNYLKKKLNVRIVKFDVETEMPVRDADGLCIETDEDEVGEALGEIREEEIRFRFDGYSGDPTQTEKKILRDVFAKGDAWFRTGDLMKQDREGYFYFIDRIGDTFRWKGENVSTNEVGEVLSVFPGVADANVYGVKVGALDGRAGMAAVTLAPNVDLAALRRHLESSLPAYARPLFLRVQPQIEVTGTFKYRKVDLVKEGFDPATCPDPIYFDHPQEKRFVPLTPELHAQILAGAFRF